MVYHEGSYNLACLYYFYTSLTQYFTAMMMTECTHLLLTIVHAEYPCDSFFPEIDLAVFRKAEHHEFEQFAEERLPQGRQIWEGVEYEFVMYVRR